MEAHRLHHPGLTASPDQTAAEISRCALASLHASAALFYWIENGEKMADVSLAGISTGFYRSYASEMEPVDPSNILRMTAARAKLTQLRQAGHPLPDDADRYTQLLRRFQVTDVIDLMFWADGIPLAGIGILKRQGDPPTSDTTLAVAGAMQRYMEFNLQHHTRFAQARRNRALRQIFGLTSREIAVAECILQGQTNADIAKTMNIRLATVKSHLMQIFGKTNCGNRTKLAAILNAAATA